jgi:CcmD family protein
MNPDNFTFLTYGLVIIWLILFAYVASIASRERKLAREIEALKQMLKEPRG